MLLYKIDHLLLQIVGNISCPWYVLLNSLMFPNGLDLFVSSIFVLQSLKNAATANARERARMQVLSKAFVKLKTTLPWVPPDTKLSKLDTLRLATSYIAHLRQILAEDDEEEGDGAAATGGEPVQPADTSSGGSAASSPTQPSSASVHPINFVSTCFGYLGQLNT